MTKGNHVAFDKSADPYHYSKLFVAEDSGRGDPGFAFDEDAPAWGGDGEGTPPSLVTSAAILQRTTDAFTSPETQEFQEANPNNTITVHIPEGPAFRAAVRVLRRLCIKSRASEVLLPVDPRHASHRYVLLRPPSTPAPDLSSDSAFTSLDPPPSLLVRRVSLTTAPPRARLMVCASSGQYARGYECIRVRGVATSVALVHAALARKPWRAPPPRLTPLALPSGAAFLAATRAALAAHNAAAADAEVVLLLPDAMLRRLAAAVSIQAAWRAFIHRRPLNLTYTVLARRAAVCIQRAWRSYLFQQHCRALAAAQLLVQCTQVLSYVPSLCLTLRGARMIALAQGRRCDVLPGQKLRWAFLKDSGSLVLVAPDDTIRPGLPEWLGCSIPVIPESLCFPTLLNAVPAPSKPPWFTAHACLGPDGRAALTDAPKGAASCLQLLEASTRVREVNGHRMSTGADGTLVHDLVEDEALRIVVFASAAEARHRAALMLLLTWDCWLGQATELLPVSHTLGAAEASSAACAPPGAIDRNQVEASVSVSGRLQAEMVQSGVATLIALSLPGDSSLLPYITSIAGSILESSKGAAVTGGAHALSTVRMGPQKVTKKCAYLHDSAEWLQRCGDHGPRTSVAAGDGRGGAQRHGGTAHDARNAQQARKGGRTRPEVETAAVGAVGGLSGTAARTEAFAGLCARGGGGEVGEGDRWGRAIATGLPHDLDTSLNHNHLGDQNGHVPENLEPCPTSEVEAANSGPLEQPHIQNSTVAAARDSLHVVQDRKVNGTRIQLLSDGSQAVHLADNAVALHSRSRAEQQAGRAIAELVAAGGSEALRSCEVTKMLAGEFGRRQQKEHAAFLKLRTADILMRKRIIVEVVRSLPAMRPRPTGTGNALAPLYSPLSIATVSHAVAQLKRVWAQHNHALVCALKDAHRDALASMHAELQAAKQERAAVIRAEAAVAARAAVEAREEDICAAQARVRVGEARRVRQAARRKVLKASRSIGAAAAAEGRLVSGQQLLRAAERSARAIATAGERRREVAERDAENADAVEEHLLAKKIAAAAALRAEGYTDEVHAAYVAAWQEKQQRAAWVREARLEALARVGPAGGLWGAAVPWDVARQPYPVKLVAAVPERALPPAAGSAEAAEPQMPDPMFEFMTISTGNGPVHAAKVAFGQYVGTVPTAFGSLANGCVLPEPVFPATGQGCQAALGEGGRRAWESTLRR